VIVSGIIGSDKKETPLFHLDTFAFQAPHFYEKYGYEQWGVLDGYAGKLADLLQKNLTKENQ
jgi:hypothetical protein